MRIENKMRMADGVYWGQHGGSPFCQNCTSKFVHYSQELEFRTIFKQCLKMRYSPYVDKGFVYISVSKI